MTIIERSSETISQRGPDHEVVIVGAGFGGIGAAIELARGRIDDFVIIEKWGDVGGTWRANTYPGVAVDIPSFVYSFSYEQRSDWSRLFAPGSELVRYAEDVVAKHDLRPRIHFQTTVCEMVFDEDDDLWRLLVRDRSGLHQVTCRYVISGIGALERPQLPPIDGIGDFGGRIIHTARWDGECDLVGRRVACIGTGASALQLIPEIADQVERLDVYQRTPIWVAPKYDPSIGPLARTVMSVPPVRSSVRAVTTVGFDVLGNAIFQHRLRPLQATLEFALRSWMRSQIADPFVRDALIPDYAFGCKRPSMSNTYLRTFNRENVTLVTTPIESITPTGVRTVDGQDRTADVLICATGFKIMAEEEPVPFPIYGRGGAELGKFWLENRFQAYQGVSVPGFPNLFSIAGPYGFVVGSYFWMIEATAKHAARVISEAVRRGATRAEIRPGPHEAYVERCRSRYKGSPLFGSACASSNTYYINFQGDSPLRPSSYAEMWFENRFFPIDNYAFLTTSPRARPPAKTRRGRPPTRPVAARGDPIPTEAR